MISTGAISDDLMLSSFNRDSADLTAAVIERAMQTVLVVESSKFGAKALSPVAPLDSIDVLVTDSQLPASFREAIGRTKVKLVTVDP